MAENVDRRDFLKHCIATGAGTMLAAWAPFPLVIDASSEKPKYEVSTVTGENYFGNTVKAVELLGGMKRFVKEKSKVGLLINSVFDRTGTFVRPDIAFAVLQMCFDAGAAAVFTIESTPSSFWRRSALADKYKSLAARVSHSDAEHEVTVDRATIIKTAEVSTTLMTVDTFINIPIVKDHRGTRYTGALKNMMGGMSSATNRRCHFGDASRLSTVFTGYYDKLDILAQGIADINLIRKPDLCIVDATEILATNGPAGPGTIKKPNKVIAGTNALAADMVAVGCLDLKPEELLVIKKAQELGIGPASMQEVKLYS